MKKIIIALAAGTLLLTGCAAPDPATDGTQPGPGYNTSGDDSAQNPYTYNTSEHVGVDEYLITLSDGRKVTCLFQTTAGALSCDWEHVDTSEDGD